MLLCFRMRGMDVTLFNVDNSIQWCTFKEHQIPVMSQDLRMVEGRIDQSCCDYVDDGCIS